MDVNSVLEVAAPDAVVEQVITTEQPNEQSETVAEAQTEVVTEVQAEAKTTAIDFGQVQSIIESFNAIYASESEQVEQALIDYVSANPGFVDAVSSFLSALSIARALISKPDLDLNLDSDTDGEEVVAQAGEEVVAQAGEEVVAQVGEDVSIHLETVAESSEEIAEESENEDVQVSPSTEEEVAPALTEEPKPLLFGAFELPAFTQDTNLDAQLATVFTTEVQADSEQESAPAEVVIEGETAQATPSLAM